MATNTEYSSDVDSPNLQVASKTIIAKTSSPIGSFDNVGEELLFKHGLTCFTIISLSQRVHSDGSEGVIGCGLTGMRLKARLEYRGNNEHLQPMGSEWPSWLSAH